MASSSNSNANSDFLVVPRNALVGTTPATTETTANSAGMNSNMTNTNTNNNQIPMANNNNNNDDNNDNNNNNSSLSPSQKQQQQQQSHQGYPDIPQHLLVSRLIREISVKVHHASSGKMTAEEITAVEAASKKANRRMMRGGADRNNTSSDGTSVTMTSGHQPQQPSASVDAKDSRRLGRKTSDRFLSADNNNNNNTQNEFGMNVDDGRSPSAAARRSGHSRSPGGGLGKKKKDKKNSSSKKALSSDEKDELHNASKSKNAHDNMNRLVFSRSMFDKLPRASAIPEGFFKKHQLLGTGAFAQTYLCEWVSEQEEKELEKKLKEEQEAAMSRKPTARSSSSSSLSHQAHHRPPSAAKKIQVSPQRSSSRGNSARGMVGGVFSSNNVQLYYPTHTSNNNNNNFVSTAGGGGGGSRYLVGANSQLLLQAKSPVIGQLNHNNNNISKSNNQDPHSTDLASPLPGFALSRGGAGGNTNISMIPQAATFTASQLASPYGQVSHLSSTRPAVPSGVDGTQIPRDRAFVCKFEPAATALRRLECMGQAQNPNIAEEHILANCAHPNIVAFVDNFQDSENNNVLVMEYVDGGDLKHELDRRSEKVVMSTGEVVNSKHFSERSILFLFVQMVMAMEYLHRHNILHRDLKTPNILLSKKWLVKISDFGLAKQFDTDVDLNVSVSNVGTPYYLSPSQWKRRPYSEKADIWCLGVILFELITLKKPFDGETVKDLARAVCLDPPIPFNRSTISDDLKNLCLLMLEKKEEDRPSAKDILQMPIMQVAMQDFLEKFGIATSTSTSSVDVSWNRVLNEQRKLVLNEDGLSSSKSRRSLSKERSSKRHSAYANDLHSKNSSSRRGAGGGGRGKDNNSSSSSGGSSTTSSSEGDGDDDGGDDDDDDDKPAARKRSRRPANTGVGAE